MKTLSFLLVIVSLFLVGCVEKDVKNKKGSARSETHKSNHQDHNKSNKQMHKTSFEDLAKAFERSDRAEWQRPDFVISLMGDLSDKIVGDIGAGTGYFSFRIAPKAKEVVGIDVDQRFINYIQKERLKDKVDNLSTRLVDYDDPHLGDGEFDILLIVNTYHHIDNRIAYLKKCKKGLAKGGKMMVVDFKKKETPMGPPVDHRLKPLKVKNELVQAGFSKVQIDSTNLIYQYIVIAE